MNDVSTVGLIGLGLMGRAIGSKLLKSGLKVIATDISEEAKTNISNQGAITRDTPAAIAGESDVILLSLPNGNICNQVIFGENGIVSAGRSLTILDTSTIAPEQAEEIAKKAKTAEIEYLDVGLSGTSSLIDTGDILSMVGGSANSFDAAESILKHFCHSVNYMGSSGNGMRAKLIVNHALAINRFAAAESLLLAKNLGVEPRVMLDVLNNSFARSEAMRVWGPRMVNRDFDNPSSHMEQHNKDATLIRHLAQEADSPTPVLDTIHAIVQRALERGFGPKDNSAIIEALRTDSASQTEMD